MKAGVTTSVLAHAALLIIAIVGLGSAKPLVPEVVESIAVDLVPIHPGLAKYMREKGVWDKKWDARIAKNIPVAEELVLAHIGTQMLGLPKSY